MPLPWRSVLTRMVLPLASVVVLNQRSWMLPAIDRLSLQSECSGGVVVGLLLGPRADVGGVVAQVLTDANCGRPEPLATPRVDGLDTREAEHRDQVFRGEVALWQSATEDGAR